MAVDCHLGFVDHVPGPPMKVLGGFCHCTKFGWNNAVGSFNSIEG